jgi:transposase
MGSCLPRHRAKEFLRCLNHMENQVPADRQQHVIMGNYSIHKSAAAQRWLKPKKRRRFDFHFTPISSCWRNQVERLFGLITDKMIRRGTFHSVEDLERAMCQWLANWNNEPQPSVWKATADVILDKARRCRQAIGRR